MPQQEWDVLQSQFATTKRRTLPYVFTEQGVSMLSAVLNSDQAIEASIQIMNAFVNMRKFFLNNASVFQPLDQLELKQLQSDEKFERIFKALEAGQVRPDKGIFFNELKSRNKLTGEIDFAGGKTSDSITGYFAYIETINGFSKTLYMTKEQVTSHAKKYSASFSFANSAWQTNFDEMALKTVLRNLLSHYGFLSIEMMGAIETDLNEDARTQRDEQVSTLTAIKNINMDDTEFEEISGKPDQGNSISQNGTPASPNTPINPEF